jgi:DNA-binding transcriptional LysR family regulator
MDPLSGISVFAAVADAQSFTQAAKRLGMSKSSVSKSVTRLEERLGARLINRTTRRLSLTEVGHDFHQRCSRIVEEAEAAEQAINRLQESPRGTLRVNAPLSFGLRHLGPALPEFMVMYPELKLDIDFLDRRVDLIEEGYDVAVRSGALDDSSLIARRLAPNRLVAVAAPAYLERHGTPAQPKALASHNCLTYAYLPSPGAWQFQLDGQPFAVSVSGSLQTNNGDVILDAVLAGLGIAMAPTFICGAELAAGNLHRILADFEPEPYGIHAIYPHSRHLPLKVRVFIDFFADRFGDQPYWDCAWV